MGTHLPSTQRGTAAAPLFSLLHALAVIPVGPHLPITSIVDYVVLGGRLSWQCYRISATRLVIIMLPFHSE